MTDTNKLEQTYLEAEAKAHKLQAEKDDAVQKARDRFADKLRQANDEAAAAQKEWLDAVAAEALLDRPDGEAVARALDLTLPT